MPNIQVREIESRSNKLPKQVRLLHERAEREKTKTFLIEGAKLINEAIANGVEILDIVVSDSYLKEGLPLLNQERLSYLTCVPDSVFAQMAATTTPQGVLATAKIFEHTLAECLKPQPPLLMVLDQVQDPGNVGTMIRTAMSFGASGVILTEGCADAHSPKVLRAAMGANFNIPVIEKQNPQALMSFLHDNDIHTVALDPRAPSSFTEINLRQPLAFFFGNEGHGFSSSILSGVKERAAIYMTPAAESLNIAICAGIVMFETARCRAL